MPASPKPRTGAAGCVVGDRIFIFGGLNDSVGWLNDVVVFDIKANQWLTDVPVQGNAPAPRDKHSCTLIGNKIYVFGGFGPQTVDEPEQDEDEDDEDDEPEPATFGWFNDMFELNTGKDGAIICKFANALTETMTWSKVKTEGTTPTPRAAFGGMATIGSAFYVFGGRDPSQRQNDLYMFETSYVHPT